MTDQAKAAEIVARLERLTAPDREVNREIDWHFSEWENMGGYLVRHKITGEMKGTSYPESPTYTASLDAAIGLVERVLPGWARYVEFIDGIDPTLRKYPATADLWLIPARTKGLRKERFRAEAPTEPLALLIALFRALAQGE